MEKFVFWLAGVVFTMGVFLGLGFTAAVYPENVIRAEQMCKNGEWVKIDNAYITCKDGAEYPRQGEYK